MTIDDLKHVYKSAHLQKEVSYYGSLDV